MAKGNFWTRSVRGRVGDMVFYKSNGEQMTRSYNGNPANPRTDAQLRQRIKWTDTCLAYDFLKPVISETMVKRPQDQNNFNTFVSENVGKAPIVTKAVAELAKSKGVAIAGEYTISKGGLSGFASNVLRIKKVESGSENSIRISFVDAALINSICESRAEGADTVTIPFAELLGAYMVSSGYPNAHIGFAFAFADIAHLDAPFFGMDYYFELWDNSLINAVTFTKEDNEWVTDNVKHVSGEVDIFTNSFDRVFTITLASGYLSDDVVYGYAVFRCQHLPKRDTETKSFTLSPKAVEMLAELVDSTAVAEAIASYRRSASAEDEQVFHG